MLEKISETVARICLAENLRQFDAALRHGMEALGFVGFNLTVGKQRAADFMTDPTVTSFSSKDLEHYDRMNWQSRDPQLQLAARIGPEIIWLRDDWREQHGEYHEYLVEAGLQSGITIPLTQPGGRLAAMTMVGPNTRHLPDLAPAARIIAHTAQARLAALGNTAVNGLGRRAQFRELSQTQREVLHWAAMGKTNSEIGMILGQTRRGIDYHMSEIMRKLAVERRVQAIVIYAQENA